MLLDHQEEDYDACFANEIRFFKLNSRNHKSNKRQVPEYVFFTRFETLCYLVAGGLGLAFQTLLIFWIMACFFG
jgi:hypothetical protein